MPKLSIKNEFLAENLEINLELLHLENPSAWEGWIRYELKLCKGSAPITQTGDNATMMNTDFEQLCRLLTENGNGSFEPMEPDFQVIKTINEANEDLQDITVMLDEGISAGRGYAKNYIGVKMTVTSEDAEKFGTELRERYDELVSGVRKVAI